MVRASIFLDGSRLCTTGSIEVETLANAVGGLRRPTRRSLGGRLWAEIGESDLIQKKRASTDEFRPPQRSYR
jgi:hypothetical protein